jgi:hypothetical protein
LGPEVKVIFRKKHAAAIFGDEGMGMRQLATRLVYLEARAVSEPHCRDAVVIESGSEFVEARDAFSTRGKQVINGDV